jgi:tRNA modification GTPase
VVLVVFEAQLAINDEDRRILDRFRDRLAPGAARIHVYNKIDLAGQSARCSADSPREVWLSAKTGEGIEHLREALLAVAGWERGTESPFLARERHLRALAAARVHLESAEARQAQWELFAEELRLAQEALGAITGRVSADDLLGEIFSRFCIGK